MKKVLFFLVVLFFAANVFAQNGNDRISYQAVVRNSDNRLVYNENLTVTVTITNVPGGPVVYSETHNVTSNANGLISLLVGNGTEHTGNWNDIQWKTAQLSTRIVKAGTQEVLAEQDMPLTAVPYARYADYTEQVNPEATTVQNIYNKMHADSLALGTLIDANAAHIGELQGMDEALSARIAADSNNLAGFKAKARTDSATLRNLINTNTENISELQETDEALSARITADSNNLAGFKAKARTDSTTLRNLIDTNADNITIANSNLTALQNRVNTFNTNVCDSVDACVKEIVSDTASALRGLIENTDDKFGDYYTKTQTENLLGAKADTSSVYTRTVIDTKLANYTTTADLQATYATKAKVKQDSIDLGALINAKADTSSVYTKDQINTLIGATAANIDELQEMDEALSARIAADSNNLAGFKAKARTDSTTLRNLINTNTDNITITNNNLTALQNRVNTFNTNVCDSVDACVKEIVSDTASALRGLIENTDDKFGDYYTKTQADDLLGAKADTAILAKVAKTGSYNDLSDKPEINNATLTLKQGNATLGTFTANASQNQEIVIPAQAIPELAAVTAIGNSAGNRQLKDVSDPTDAQDAVTKSYLTTLTTSIQQQLTTLASSFQNQLDSLGGVIEAQQATINAQQHQLDSLINSGTTPPTPAAPTATTSPATDLAATSATLNGTVSNSGNVAITAQGFEWKATTGGTYTAVNATGGTMTYSLTGLTANTSYTYRAFVTTASGTSYGDEVSFTTASAPVFTCGTSTVTDFDNNTYNTVQIGSQCWMKENMRATHYADGTSVPAGGSNTSSTAPYYYDYSSSNIPLAQRGYLYNWPAAMHSAASSAASPSGVQGICPNGWHVPSHAEWTTMKDYVGSQSAYVCGGNSSYIAKALASAEGWITHTGNCTVGNDLTANNATGFSAVPAGYYGDSSFDVAGVGANFWSSTQSSSGNAAYFRHLNNYAENVAGTSEYKYIGFSVRCLRD